MKQTKMELQGTDAINTAREYKERNYNLRKTARVRDRIRFEVEKESMLG